MPVPGPKGADLQQAVVNALILTLAKTKITNVMSLSTGGASGNGGGGGSSGPEEHSVLWLLEKFLYKVRWALIMIMWNLSR